VKTLTLVRLALGVASVCLLLIGLTARGQEPAPEPKKTSYQFPPVLDPKRLFRLESEASLIERMVQASKTGDNPFQQKYDFIYPDYPPVPKAAGISRPWEPLAEIVEPPYVCYRRLYFEQINSERYGWDLGPLHPLLSAGVFCFDVVTLPYHVGLDPLRRYECNTGYFLPGDPVPFLLYPPELSLTGAATEAAVIGLMFVMFP
jgi:hypothetical protein